MRYSLNIRMYVYITWVLREWWRWANRSGHVWRRFIFREASSRMTIAVMIYLMIRCSVVVESVLRFWKLLLLLKWMRWRDTVRRDKCIQIFSATRFARKRWLSQCCVSRPCIWILRMTRTISVITFWTIIIPSTGWIPSWIFGWFQYFFLWVTHAVEYTHSAHCKSSRSTLDRLRLIAALITTKFLWAQE